MRERQEEFIGYLQAATSIPAGSARSPSWRSTCTATSPRSEWADIMPQILHVHAKFYDIDENGQEPAIDYPELVRVFVEGGYARLLVERMGGPRLRRARRGRSAHCWSASSTSSSARAMREVDRPVRAF